VEGRQDLKTATKRDDCVHITPSFRADPHTLGTTLFEGGEDDMGTKEEVSPISGLHQDEGSSLRIGTSGQPTICNDLV
jgi:hypothetical protein